METYISREIEPKIKHWLGKEKVLIIKGIRQAGKTTLMKNFQQNFPCKTSIIITQKTIGKAQEMNFILIPIYLLEFIDF